MEPKFYLSCSGSVGTPPITHAIFVNNSDKATEEAIRVIEKLSQCGYMSFRLFEGSSNPIKDFVAKVETKVDVKVYEPSLNRR